MPGLCCEIMTVGMKALFSLTLFDVLRKDREGTELSRQRAHPRSRAVGLVETINPRLFIPVHAEDRHFFEEQMPDRAGLLFPEPGARLRLGDLVKSLPA